MRHFILMFTIPLVLATSGCDKNLDFNPLDQISSSNFWKSKAEVDMGLTSCYSRLQIEHFSVQAPVFDCITDNGHSQQNFNLTNQIAGGEIDASTGGYISDVYSNCYSAIMRINLFLEEVGKYEGSDIPAGDKSRYEAEARFLRAFFYYQLYFYYGDVPLVVEPLTLETQFQPKVDAGVILDQILADLDFAIANLNDVPYRDNNGHATSSSAKALKARILGYAAYSTPGVPDPEVLTEVRDLTLDIQSQYSLSPKFEDVFRDAGQSGNPEIIFSVNYLSPNSVASWDLYYGDWILVSPLQNFVDAFECTDGLPFGVSPLTDLADPMKDRDPRLDLTVFVDIPDWGGGNTHSPTNLRPTGFGLKKYLEPTNTPYGYSTLSQQDGVLLRLSEVLLLYAEAQNEIAGPDITVYDAINEVRERVSMPPIPAGLTKEQMRERIRQERRVELAFENGLRMYDLKRWGTANDVLNNVTDGIIPYHFENRFYKWPLPQAEIDKSNGILIQNADY